MKKLVSIFVIWSAIRQEKITMWARKHLTNTYSRVVASIALEVISETKF